MLPLHLSVSLSLSVCLWCGVGRGGRAYLCPLDKPFGENGEGYVVACRMHDQVKLVPAAVGKLDLLAPKEAPNVRMRLHFAQLPCHAQREAVCQ
jgi:hypothetical protein